MKVIVTGANGFIGSWLTRKLSQNGYAVKILRRKSSDLSQISDLQVQETYGDILDLNSLKNAFTGVEAVFHLAGVVGYSKAQREVMDKANIEGTKNVLEACLHAGVKRMIYASSVVAVGASFDGNTPLNENHSYNLRHLNLGYFESKRIAEELALSYVKDKGVDCVLLNPSTVYGPGDALKGSRGVQRKVANEQMPFYTSGGVSVANIQDVVDGFVSALKNGKKGERYILAGENITIKNLFKTIAQFANKPAPSIYLPNSLVRLIGLTGDQIEKLGKKPPINTENAWSSILFHWFDSSKAINELGYNITPAKTSIEQSVRWMKENGLIR